MSRYFLHVFFAALFLLSAPAKAEIEAYDFDKVHTQIFFTVSHLGFSESTGQFLDFDGELNLDHADPAKSGVDVTIKTSSLEMNHDKWNEHLKNADFFNVEKFPTMTFKSTNVTVTGDHTADVTGDLTILGITKPVVLKVVHNKTDKHPFSGKMATGFSATAMVKRSDFGMGYGLPAVGDDVHIRITVEATRQGDDQPVGQNQ